MTIKNVADVEISLIDLQNKLNDLEKILSKHNYNTIYIQKIFSHLESEFKRINSICAKHFNYQHFDACREIFLKLLKLSKKLNVAIENATNIEETITSI